MAGPKCRVMGFSMGPRNNDTRNSANNTAAFKAIGPRETTAMRINGLGGYLPLGSGNDFTNMYAITEITAMQIGNKISEKSNAAKGGRAKSPESFSDGWPSLCLL